MDTLDEDDVDAFLARPIGIDEPPPRRRLSLRPFLLVLVVAVLGGGLGTGAYFLSNLDSRAIIALLDVGDQPRLAIQMPERGSEAKPVPSAADGLPMLHPPAEPGSEAPPLTMTPPPMPSVPPASEAPSHAANVIGVAPAVEAPAAPAPIIVRQEKPQGPLQPLPRAIDRPPSFVELATPETKATPLSAVPAEGMTRHSPYGPVPVVASDGRQSWQVYARPFAAKDDKPRLAVIVSGLGSNREATEMAIERLPADVSLAFSPYAADLDNWVKKARDAGHEVLLMLPVEESGFPARDPGPFGLTTSARPEDNADHLIRVLARTAGYVGVVAVDGPFTRSQQLASILAMLKERGLLYVGNGAAAEPKPPVITLAGWLDADVFRDAIAAREKAVAGQTRAQGSRAVLTSARPASLAGMPAWLASLAAEGIVLAPVSALVGPQGGKS